MKLIGWTSKTGHAFGLPAGKTCPGKSRKKKSMCPKSCYGKRANYMYPSVKMCQAKRLDLAMNYPETFVKQVSERLIKLARKDNKRNVTFWFRLHDSGDFFSVDYIRLWMQIIRIVNQSGVRWKLWAPTKSWSVPKLLKHLQELALLPNTAIRPSALEFDKPAPVVVGLGGGMAVTSTGEGTCPASKRHWACRQSRCRKCYRPDGEVTFPKQ